MKKLIFTLSALFLICVASQAQSKKDLKGPKAKNYKVWQDDNESATVYTSANQESIKGPEAKNQKTWTARTSDENKIAVKRDTRRTSLKGPAAKNYKPWK